MLTYTPTHIPTYTHVDKVITISAPPYYVVGAGNTHTHALSNRFMHAIARTAIANYGHNTCPNDNPKPKALALT